MLRLIVAGLLVFPISLSVRASLIGDEISVSNPFATNATATIGAGVEFPFETIIMSFDFEEDILVVRNLLGYPSESFFAGSFGYGSFNFYNFDSFITGVKLISNTGWTSNFVSPGGYTFTESSLTLDTGRFSENYVEIGAEAIFRIETSSSIVPISSTVSLLGIGILSLAYWRKRLAKQ